MATSRRNARKDFKKNHPEGVNVRSRCYGLAFEKLRRHIGRRSKNLVAPSYLLAIRRGQPPTGHDDTAAVLDADICGLEVSMNNALAVRVRNAAAGLPECEEKRACNRNTIAQQISKTHTVAGRIDQVDTAVL